MSDFKRALTEGMHGALCGAEAQGTDLDRTREIVFNAISYWFDQYPGLEDNTVECIACHEPTTKANRIESVHRGAPVYLCERCHDGITGEPVGHSQKARVVIGQTSKVTDSKKPIPPVSLSDPISKLVLNSNINYSLISWGHVQTVGDLVFMSESELLNLWLFGPKSLEEVKRCLAVHGLKLAQEDRCGREEGGLEVLSLGWRIYDFLGRSGVQTIDDLVAMTEDQLRLTYGIGVRSVAIIKAKLELHGLTLRSEE